MKKTCNSISPVFLQDGDYRGHISSNVVTVRVKREDSYVSGIHTQDITFKTDMGFRGIFIPCKVTVKNSSAIVEV